MFKDVTSVVVVRILINLVFYMDFYLLYHILLYLNKISFYKIKFITYKSTILKRKNSRFILMLVWLFVISYYFCHVPCIKKHSTFSILTWCTYYTLTFLNTLNNCIIVTLLYTCLLDSLLLFTWFLFRFS
jgi:hypothetical protein